MFTGIVESVGTLAEVKATGGGYRVRIQTPLAAELKLGDSLAVNGVCLTSLPNDRGVFVADLSNETLSVTSLGSLAAGAREQLTEPRRRLRRDHRRHLSRAPANRPPSP